MADPSTAAIPTPRRQTTSTPTTRVHHRFARTATRWLEREEATGRVGSSATAQLASVDAAAPLDGLVRAVALSRRAPESDGLADALELRETAAMVRRGRAEAEDAFAGAGMMGGKSKYAVALWTVFGLINVYLAAWHLSLLMRHWGASVRSWETPWYFDMRQSSAASTPEWLVPPSVERCLSKCS